MSVKKFKFVSPGVFIDEIDNSQLPNESTAIGPVIIGRAPQGPSMRPVRVNSFSEFVQIFGAPMPGGQGSDVWREGNQTTPMYGMYAAQAWLRNSAPLTYVRLLGEQHSKANAYAGYGGWETWLKGAVGTSAEIGIDRNANGGAYGLFISPTTGSSNGTTSNVATGSLAAVVYLTEGSFELSGTVPGPAGQKISGSAVLVLSKAASKTFTAVIKDRNNAVTKRTDFNFNKNSDQYIRKVLNTSPILTSNQSRNQANRQTYWLGETFDRSVADLAGGDVAAGHMGVVMALGEGTSSWQHHREGAKKSNTGWVISQDLRAGAGAPAGGFDPTAHPNHTSKLFRFISLDSGEWSQNNIKVSIQDIKVATDTYDPYGSFTVVVRKIDDNDGAVRVLEKFSSCNLNPNSINYIARKIGDRYTNWDEDTKSYIEYGNFDNLSQYLYVDMASDVDAASADPLLLPYGFYGPTKAKNFSIAHDKTGSATFGDGSVNYDGAYVKAHDLIAGSACLANGNAGTILTGSAVDRFVLMNVSPYDSGLRQASTTITITNAGEITANNTISVVTKAGDTVTITGHADTNAMADTTGASTNGTFAAGTTVSGTPASNNVIQAAAIAAAFNLHDDLTATNSDTAIVTITQNTGGVVTSTPTVAANGGDGTPGSGTTIAAFSGGSEITTALNPLEVANTIDSTIHMKFPTFALRSGSVDNNLGSSRDAYFGFDSTQTNTSIRYERSNGDIARRNPVGLSAGSSETAFIFTLDDLRKDAEGIVHYSSGSRSAGNSITAVSGNYTDVIDAGHSRFTMPLHGGFDGLNITERDPFNSTSMEDKTEKNSSTFYSVKKAIDTVGDAEVVEMNLASVPGMWHEGITSHLINTCEDRGDALAVVDLKGGYEPAWESGAEVLGTTSTTISNLRSRGMNSSYACAYYPWVRIKDPINGSLLWVPPSIAGIGTMASSEAKSALWFSPAGFTRGGLTEGSAGVPVIGVRQRLTSTMRDDLYEANINPIATFPAEGIVIFGQKTLQVTPSALDRINVRRLMIFIKKEISRIASTTLFEQNVPATWANFTARAIPFLRDIKVGLGLTDFKVVLDESTTTEDLIDRNIMYAKIFLKPARAIEFIALDFVVSRSGASFED
jgi:hypothetical protein